MTKNNITVLKKKAKRLATLIEVSTIINSSLDLDKVISLVLEKTQEVMDAEAGSVLLLNHETNRLEVQSALGNVGSAIKKNISLEMGQGIAGWVAKEKKSLNVADVQNDPRFFKGADKITGFQTKSMLASPLIFKDKLIGVAEVINRRDGKSFSSDDEDLFNTFCGSVAMAVENARLHRVLLERERIQQQLESAQVIQQSFLPQSFPKCENNRFETWAAYKAAKSIGGDFYDFLMLDENHLAIVIGDVCGKGIPAALYMARVLSDFRFFTQLNNPSETVSRLNKQLVERSRNGMFVTLAYAVLNAKTGLITYVNAGHGPMLRINHLGNKVDIIGLAKEIPLAIREESIYQQESFQLEHGDYLVLFTDGISEARNIQGEQMSLEILADIIAKPWESPKMLTEFVLNKVLKLSKNSTQHDDLTLVAIRWN